MKKKTIIGRLVCGEIVDPITREPLLCDRVFELFQDAPEVNGEKYEITISNRETKGARRFYFEVISTFNDVLEWCLTERGDYRSLYCDFGTAVYETLGEKQKKKDIITPRWISFKIVR